MRVSKRSRAVTFAVVEQGLVEAWAMGPSHELQQEGGPVLSSNWAGAGDSCVRSTAIAAIVLVLLVEERGGEELRSSGIEAARDRVAMLRRMADAVASMADLGAIVVICF